MVHWWDRLSGSELRQRLEHRGCSPARAYELVERRGWAQSAAEIDRWLQ